MRPAELGFVMGRSIDESASTGLFSILRTITELVRNDAHQFAAAEPREHTHLIEILINKVRLLNEVAWALRSQDWEKLTKTEPQSFISLRKDLGKEVAALENTRDAFRKVRS